MEIRKNSLGFNVLKDWKSYLFWKQAYGEGAVMPKLLLVMHGLGSSEIGKLTFGILPASKWKWCLHIQQFSIYILYTFQISLLLSLGVNNHISSEKIVSLQWQGIMP